MRSKEELMDFPDDEDAENAPEEQHVEDEDSPSPDPVTEQDEEEAEEEMEDERNKVKIEVGLSPNIKNAVKNASRRKRIEEKETGMKISSDEEVENFIEEFSPGNLNKRFIRLNRLEPKTYRGKKCDGFLERFDRSITLEEVKEMYGGGVYEIKMYGPRIDKKTGAQKGNSFLSARRFAIVGDPVILASQAADNAPTSEIVGATLRSHEKLAERESERAERNSEKFENILMKMVDGGGGSKEMLVMMQGFMTQMQEQNRAQLETQQRQLQIMQEKYERDQERLREDSRRERENAESRAKNEMNPLLQLMLQQSKENTARAEMMMAQAAKMAELQISSSQKTNETQIQLIQNGAKTQVDVLMQQLNNLSSELKEARAATNKDAMSELKKLVQLKELLKDIGNEGETPEKTSITDKIMENLPQIQEAVGAFAQLFMKPQAGVTPNRQMLAPGSAPPPPPPPSPTMPNPAPKGTSAPANASKMKEVEIAMLVNKLKLGAEEYISNDKPASEFIDNEILGKFDDMILKQIAMAPTKAVIEQLESSFEDADPESTLFTKRGKDFLRDAHTYLKTKVI